MTEYALTADGRHLAYQRRGSGSPVVFLEAGSGAASSSWQLVVDELASVTTVISYDRAGLGESEPDAQPRVLSRLVEDFTQLVGAVAPSEPFVIVGHSLGGIIARQYAYLNPERVAALVLVDPTSEDFLSYFEGPQARLGRAAYRVSEGLARLGLFEPAVRRRLLLGSFENAFQRIPTVQQRDALRREQCRPSTLRTARREFTEVPRGIRELVAVASVAPTPEIPVTVISGSLLDKGDPHRAEIVAIHARFAESLPNGRHVLSPISGHIVPLDDPRTIIDEIVRVVTLVRQA